MRKHLFQNYIAQPGVTFLMLTLITLIAFISGLILAPYLIGPALATEQPASSSGALPEDEILAVYDNALTKIYAETVPAVVKLDITRPGTDTEAVKGQGSGFVWDRAGHIVTNFHAVHRAERIIVTFVDGVSLEAKVVGTQPLADLAVLKVDRAPAELQPVILGNSAGLKIGQLALAIGSPFG